jgi:hypothetical protein
LNTIYYIFLFCLIKSPLPMPLFYIQRLLS